MRPHLSFDITGDGAVSQKEFAISTMFDQDKDGKLNDKEKETVIHALKNGYEQQLK
jgi:hypothetical protein